LSDPTVVVVVVVVAAVENILLYLQLFIGEKTVISGFPECSFDWYRVCGSMMLNVEDTATQEHNDERDFPTPIDPDTRVKEVKKRVQSVCKLERRLKFRVMQSGV